MKTFKAFIGSKEEFYKEFEFETVSRAFKLIKPYIKPKKVIHIVGTNGKGSTGRALATMLQALNQNVTHYTSPHLLKYNERIWQNGSDISDEKLNHYHTLLLSYLKGLEEDLSYFEYFTLLAILVSNESDYLILEAGLGGEFDATNVIKSDITVLTVVGLDHQEFLGQTIKEIATTKINACDSMLVVAKQEYKEVYEIADNLCKALYKVEVEKDFFINGFLGENVQCAKTVLKLLGFEFKKELLNDLTIKARAQKVASNVMVDVGHNPLAAKVLTHIIEDGTVLVYNAMKDKDIKGVLELFKPKIKHLEILELDNPRAVEKTKLQEICKDLMIKYKDFKKIQKDENYLVFGSFFTVEKFLQVEDLSK